MGVTLGLWLWFFATSYWKAHFITSLLTYPNVHSLMEEVCFLMHSIFQDLKAKQKLQNYSEVRNTIGKIWAVKLECLVWGEGHMEMFSVLSSRSKSPPLNASFTEKIQATGISVFYLFVWCLHQKLQDLYSSWSACLSSLMLIGLFFHCSATFLGFKATFLVASYGTLHQLLRLSHRISLSPSSVSFLSN